MTTFPLISIVLLFLGIVSCRSDAGPVSESTTLQLAASTRETNPVSNSRASSRPLLVPAPGSPIAVAESPGNIALGDVDQDNKLDLLVASGLGISVLLGQGDGQFRPANGSPIKLRERSSEMVLRDFNRDGKLDLALGSHNSYGVGLLFGNGKGAFMPAPSPILMKQGKEAHTHGLLAGDLNEDGNMDLVTVNSNPDNDVAVVLGDGRGGFTRAAGSPFAVGPSPYPGALADLNGDRHLDIIATTTDRNKDGKPVSRELTVLFGDGRAGFQRRQVPLRTDHPWFVAVSDLNADAKPDLVATHTERKELTVLLGDGQGGFTETIGSPFDLGHSAWHVAVLDLDRDGKGDVVTAAGESVRVMLGDGRGGFRNAPGSPFATGKGTWQLAVGDVNGDSKADVVASHLESHSVSVLLGQ